VIEEVVPEAWEVLTEKTVEMLHHHQRVVYEILQGQGKMKAGEIYDEYREQVEEPQTKRNIRKHLNKLQHYDLVESDERT